MMTQHTVAAAAETAALGAPAYFFERTGSTNAEATRLAEDGAPEWTLVVAGDQDEGRGRLGRTWISTPGSSLLMSVLVRPPGPPGAAPIITLAVGACMARALQAACGVAARCKWPNDLMVGEGKVGGVLVEAKVQDDRLLYAVIGVGVNMTEPVEGFPGEFRHTATSVAREGGQPEMEETLVEFLSRLKKLWSPMDPEFGARVVAAYRDVCDSLGRSVRAGTTAGRTVDGRAVDVGPSGELVVETNSGLERVAFGEIEHLR
jgi:BirA family biotin operon repressor/biotin-[acetyl-CoA-carboxylase] ligase